MFFIILGNLEPRPLACAARPRHHQRPVRDAGSPGNTCGSAALHALPRTAARCRTPSRRRHFEGRQLAGALSRERVDGCWWGPSSACTSGLDSYLEAGAFAPTTR